MAVHTQTVALQEHIVSTLANSTVPLSAEEIKKRLEHNLQKIYSYRQINRRVHELLELGIIEQIGKDNKTRLFTIPGQQLEPWQSTNQVNDPNRPTIRVNGFNYSPEALAKSMANTSWSILNDTTNKEVANQLITLILGSAAYTTLKAHSILPVADIRRPLEETNQKLKMLSLLIDTILNSELVKTGSSGNSISNQTRDDLMAKLEPWLTKLSINARSNIR